MSRARIMLLGAALAVLTAVLLGLLLPNREAVPVEFMFWQVWRLPLWATMSICIVGGAALAATGVGFLWALERRDRRRSDARAREIEGEVSELRRLLARDAAGASLVEGAGRE